MVINPKLKRSFLPLLALMALQNVSGTSPLTINKEQDNKSKLMTMGFTFRFSDPQLFNENNLDDWFESSDTVRQPGMSKATLSLQKLNKQVIGVDQRAVLFALLNPQPNGAGFAGMKRWLNDTDFKDISPLNNQKGVIIMCRAQGLLHWKLIFYHRMENVDPNVTYASFFDIAPTSDFKEIHLQFESFKPYFRGKPVDTEALDRTKIAGIGLQTYGGVYSEGKQQGPGALEIETIAVIL